MKYPYVMVACRKLPLRVVPTAPCSPSHNQLLIFLLSSAKKIKAAAPASLPARPACTAESVAVVSVVCGEPSATSSYGGEDRGSRNTMGRDTMERANTGLTQAERAAQSQQKADMARARRQQGKGTLAAGARMNSHL